MKLKEISKNLYDVDGWLDDVCGKVGSTKSYISRIEKGLIEPAAGFFLRIMNALDLQMQFVTKRRFHSGLSRDKIWTIPIK